jgi:tRNA-dihydrouridine synthase B
MGCPVPKIYSNGEGSALLNNPELAHKIITEVKKSGKPVTVKFRIGVTEDNIVTETFAKVCEDAGADLITIHGRTRDKYYSGEPNYLEIEKAKKAVKIPVIGMGGVSTAEDVIEYIMAGATAVEVGAANLVDPYASKVIVDNLPAVMDKYGIKNLNDIKGCAHNG